MFLFQKRLEAYDAKLIFDTQMSYTKGIFFRECSEQQRVTVFN